jgi:type IV secretion system protein VirB4
MATLNKALTRPAAIGYSSGAVRSRQRGHRPAGGLCQLLPGITAYSCLGGNEGKTRKDIHYFSLLWLAFKTRGRLFTNKHFGANALLANQL